MGAFSGDFVGGVRRGGAEFFCDFFEWNILERTFSRGCKVRITGHLATILNQFLLHVIVCAGVNHVDDKMIACLLK